MSEVEHFLHSLGVDSAEGFAQLMAAQAAQEPRLDREEDPPEDAPRPPPGTVVFSGTHGDRAVVISHSSEGCTVHLADELTTHQHEASAGTDQAPHVRGPEREVAGEAGVDVSQLTVDEESEGLVPGVVVRVKSSMITPRFSWGEVTHDSVGMISSRAFDPQTGELICTVNFGFTHPRWKCPLWELEAVPFTQTPSIEGAAADVRVGSVVRISAHVTEPRGGWGGLEEARHRAVGRVTGARLTGANPVVQVAFPGVADWNAAPAELEVDARAARIVRGVRVRVAPFVAAPRFNWPAGVDHSSVGEVPCH